MRIRSLRGSRWRNLSPFELKPRARVVVLWGDNGQGKTNVIEAIYFLATLRSFRTGDNGNLICAGAESAQLGAEVEVGGLERRVEVDVKPGRRSVSIDGKGARGPSAIFGGFNAVLFVPEDILLPRAAPSVRRRFLDLAVFGQERGYYREAAAFQRVLRSRNVLLRKGSTGPRLLETYDGELARLGARVVVRRRALVADLEPRVVAVFGQMGVGMKVGLRYQSDETIEAAADEEAVREALLKGFVRSQPIDERRGYTSFGPQNDDLDIRLGTRSAGEHASQGQLRSIVLALKIGELQALGERAGEPPVLLLDDLASELDAGRRKYLMEIVDELTCQTMVSTTDPAFIPGVRDRQEFQVVKGEIRG